MIALSVSVTSYKRYKIKAIQLLDAAAAPSNIYTASVEVDKGKFKVPKFPLFTRFEMKFFPVNWFVIFAF